MAEQITIANFEKVGRKFILTLENGLTMHWSDQRILDEYIDIDRGKVGDALMRGVLARIRNAHPDFVGIETIPFPVTYERPDIREVP